ncbi:reverse transcriptase domain-containing protein [Tanacetum coccineum]
MILGSLKKLSHIIKELKQNSGKDQQKKQREAPGKEKPQIILMIQPWEKIVGQKVSQSFSPNLEISFPSLGDEEREEGALIIEAEIGGHQVHRMCVDGQSSFEILYEHCFNRLRPEIRNQMIPATTSLVGFNGEIKWPLGQITLLVKIEDDKHSTSAWMDFMVVRSTSPYNGIIGRPWLRKIHTVPSTTHGIIKFPVTGGILTLRSSKIIPIECAMVSGQEDQPPPLCDLLQRNLDIFAWAREDMTGVPRHIAEHRLNVRESYQLVRQKKRGQAAKRNIAINDEVNKLVAARIMKEVHYHDWLSNLVMVKKHDNSWRMCVDFKDLNKACPKDGYPLPEIDWKVESLCGFPFKCFLDAYKGYHQIQMAEEDEEKTAFIINQGIFCYTKMPFGLKNAGATYQRLVDKAFHRQIGRNLEVYVDDLVIKSCTEDEIVRDIEETFRTLRKINMKLNPNNLLGRSVKEAEAAFRQMKEHIAKLHMLTAPEEQEKLIIYLAASKEAVSAVLMTKREAKQMPIYFVSRALRGPEVNHTSMEKLVLALVHASKRLKRYFQAHPIIVVTDQPIKNILSNPELAGRMQKWSIQLGEFGIYYRLRVSVKGQVLADFIVERPEEEGQDDPIKEEEPLPAQAFTSKLRLAKIHEGSCSMHAGTRSVVSKALRIGYYWPTMHKDARALIKACQECQGIDIAGPFPEGTGKVKFLIVAMDYFTKCIEAKPVATITGNQVKKFVWENIVCRFGLPGEIISDNGKQFRDNPFKDWCEKLCIQQHFASVKHPQTNGLVERANRSLGEGIKARLGKDNKNWMEEISHVLWVHRTMVKSSNGDTPFSLTYGTEAVIPAEIRMPTFWTTEVDVDKNNEALEINLELLEEKREQAAIREAKSKRQIEKYYNAKVRNTSFKPGDLVYRNNEASHAGIPES